MLEFNHMVSQQRKWMLYLLVLLFFGWTLTPFKKLFLGFLIGSTISFFNMSFLQKKARDLSEAILKNKMTSGLGVLLRFLLIILTVLLALRFKQFVHIGSTIFGLMVSYIIMPLERFFYNLTRLNQSNKTSENSLKDSSNE